MEVMAMHFCADNGLFQLPLQGWRVGHTVHFINMISGHCLCGCVVLVKATMIDIKSSNYNNVWKSAERQAKMSGSEVI